MTWLHSTQTQVSWILPHNIPGQIWTNTCHKRSQAKQVLHFKVQTDFVIRTLIRHWCSKATVLLFAYNIKSKELILELFHMQNTQCICNFIPLRYQLLWCLIKWQHNQQLDTIRIYIDTHFTNTISRTLLYSICYI